MLAKHKESHQTESSMKDIFQLENTLLSIKKKRKWTSMFIMNIIWLWISSKEGLKKAGTSYILHDDILL